MDPEALQARVLLFRNYQRRDLLNPLNKTLVARLQFQLVVRDYGESLHLERSGQACMAVGDGCKTTPARSVGVVVALTRLCYIVCAN